MLGDIIDSNKLQSLWSVERTKVERLIKAYEEDLKNNQLKYSKNEPESDVVEHIAEFILLPLCH